MVSRRTLLLGLSAPALEALQHAHKQVATGSREFTYLSAVDARELEAIASAIIPSDETPGAMEAGVIFFIDRALADFDQGQRAVYSDGLAAIQTRREEMFPKSSSIAALAPDQRDRLLRASQSTPFFDAVRTHVIAGFLASPEWGGNRGEAGWKLIGFQDTGVFQPPFGYYDAAL